MGSIAPAATERVVAGSRMVPLENTRPRASVYVPLLKVMLSCRFVKPLPNSLVAEHADADVAPATSQVGTFWPPGDSGST